jgi:hypothetical protein
MLTLVGHQYLCSCREHLSIPIQLRGVVWSIQRILNAVVRSPTLKLKEDWGTWEQGREERDGRGCDLM